MSTISVRLPDSLHKRVKKLAERDNVSINQFINSALEEKVSAVVTKEHLEDRAKKGNREKFRKALSKVADVEPAEDDKL